MGLLFEDLKALARSVRLALGLPAAVWFAGRNFSALAQAYERTVAPILLRVVSESPVRASMDASLSVMSSKIGLAVLCYARAVGGEPPLEVVVLAGACTRLYDDLIDDSPDRSADTRLARLFARTAEDGLCKQSDQEEPFGRSEAEVVLARMIEAIVERTPTSSTVAAFTALQELHMYQCLSRRQREPDISLALIEEITRGKGAYANLVLCHLVRPEIPDADRELAMRLGSCLQLLDDYMDLPYDQFNGIVTLASARSLSLAEVAERLRLVCRQLAHRHPGPGARRYGGMVYFLLLQAMAARRFPALGRVAQRAARRSAALRFTSRAAESLPAVVPQEGNR
ncbi:hypothetical protein [Peterkaempfera sp. SMS 1(5)a]|uniref:hypothetical protein n=1 Tax=Peterkaempfera podocarpi TaxID=3232308 RepID=UPI00366ED73B